ncbi:MAG: hypothetical protein ACE5JL_03520 [Dehalococcoidia bacterium]
MSTRLCHPWYNSNVQNSAQAEAIEIFREVISELTSPQRDLVLIVRRLIHACQILGWQKQPEFFWAELNGYTHDAELPSYRQSAAAHLTWRAFGLDANIALAINEDFATKKEPTSGRLWAPLHQLQAAKTAGFVNPTGRTDSRYISFMHKWIDVEEVLVIPATAVTDALRAIENICFNFASQSYSVLRFGSLIERFWRDYQAVTYGKLSNLNLRGHLEAIQQNISATQPEAWRQAAFGCRNLLHDLANCLWKDPRQTYVRLKGQGPGGKLQVSPDKPKNRLAAYLHQKGISGEAGTLLRRELERVWESLDALHDLASKGHGPITFEDVRTVVVSLFVLLGELVHRTDLEPVERYE